MEQSAPQQASRRGPGAVAGTAEWGAAYGTDLAKVHHFHLCEKGTGFLWSTAATMSVLCAVNKGGLHGRGSHDTLPLLLGYLLRKKRNTIKNPILTNINIINSLSLWRGECSEYNLSKWAVSIETVLLYGI